MVLCVCWGFTGDRSVGYQWTLVGGKWVEFRFMCYEWCCYTRAHCVSFWCSWDGIEDNHWDSFACSQHLFVWFFWVLLLSIRVWKWASLSFSLFLCVHVVYIIKKWKAPVCVAVSMTVLSSTLVNGVLVFPSLQSGLYAMIYPFSYV